MGETGRRAVVFWNEACLGYETHGLFDRASSPLVSDPELHPENAFRLRNMVSVLRRGPLAPALEWRVPVPASEPELELVHDAAYVAAIRDGGDHWLTPTARVAGGTWDAARAAAGAALAAVDAVLDGETRVAYALGRPPGHRAARARAGGYCLFNNVALAARRALDRGVGRVAVLDWDVHDGGGTRSLFAERGDILTVSLHAREAGGTEDRAACADVAVELPPGGGDGEYAAALAELVEPAVDAFRPELLLVASGQDASVVDPCGRMRLTLAGFRGLGEAARRLADRHCGGSVALVQEGGYARTYAAFCLHATLEGVLGTGPLLEEPLGREAAGH